MYMDICNYVHTYIWERNRKERCRNQRKWSRNRKNHTDGGRFIRGQDTWKGVKGQLDDLVSGTQWNSLLSESEWWEIGNRCRETGNLGKRTIFWGLEHVLGAARLLKAEIQSCRQGTLNMRSSALRQWMEATWRGKAKWQTQPHPRLIQVPVSLTTLPLIQEKKAAESHSKHRRPQSRKVPSSQKHMPTQAFL